MGICNPFSKEQEAALDNYIKEKAERELEIRRPNHYCAGRKYEPKDVIRDWDLGFNLGSAVKYLSRAGRKTCDPREDLAKAIQFIEFEILAITEEMEEDVG